MTNNSSKITAISSNKNNFMPEVVITRGTVLKGYNIRNAENHFSSGISFLHIDTTCVTMLTCEATSVLP